MGQRLDELITALEDEDADTRQRAVQALGLLGDPKAIEPMTKALNDGNFRVREKAAVALGQLGEPAFRPLVKMLADENEDSYTRWGAAAALGKMGDFRAVIPLIEALNDRDWVVRWGVVAALGNLGDSRAVIPLIAVLNDEKEDRRVRWAVAEVLGELADPAAVSPLVKTLMDEDSRVRQGVAESLNKIGWQPVTQDEKTCFLLARRDWDGLVELGDPAVEPLVKMLERRDKSVLRDVALTLGQLGHPSAVGPLIRALEDVKEDSRVRRAAAVVLGRLINTRAVDPLVNMLKDGNAWIRKKAAEVLGELADSRVFNPLVAAIRDEDSFVRESVQEALVSFASSGLPVTSTVVALIEKQGTVLVDKDLSKYLMFLLLLVPSPEQITTLKPLLLSLVMSPTSTEINELARQLLVLLESSEK